MLKTVGQKRLRRGFLVAIEGIDGAGKTTQSEILEKKLVSQGYQVSGLHEPTDGQWGKKIGELAKNGRHKVEPETELEFFLLDRMEDVAENIAPALKSKQIVIMDRYYLSSVAYQGARGLDPGMIERMNKEIAPIPDITIVLDLTPEAALERIIQKRNSTPNHFERKKRLEQVRRLFLSRFLNRPNVKIIDGDDTRSIKEIASQIWNIVSPMIMEIEEA